RVVLIEGAADSQHPITNFHGIGIAHFGNGQFTSDVDFYDRQVSLIIGADNFGWVIRFIFQPDDDLGRFVDDVLVGQYVTGFVDDEPAANTARLFRSVRVAAEEIEEPERVIGLWLASTTSSASLRRFNHGFRRDVDDGRSQL